MTPIYPQGKQAEAVMTQVPQMQGVVTPTTQVTQTPNIQGLLQQQTISPNPLTQGAMGNTSNDQIQKILQMLMSNRQMMR